MTQTLFSRRTLLSAAGITLAVPGLSMPAFAADEITVKGFDPAGNRIDVKVPRNPRRVAVNDLSVMDTLQAWNLLDRVAIGADTKSLAYLPALPANFNKLPKGLKDPQFDAIAAVKPEITFISGRLARLQSEFAAKGPVLNLAPNYAYGALKSYEDNLLTLGAIFGKTEEAKANIAATRKRVTAIATKSKGKTCAVLMLVGGRMGMLAPKGRCALISDAFGFTNVEPPRTGPAPKKGAGGPKPTAEEIRAANAKTMAKLAKANPDYVFVLNKDLAVSAPKPVALETIVEGNADWQSLSSLKAKRMVQLTHSAWYLGEGGITSMDLILKDIEGALGL